MVRMVVDGSEDGGGGDGGDPAAAAARTSAGLIPGGLGTRSSRRNSWRSVGCQAGSAAAAAAAAVAAFPDLNGMPEAESSASPLSSPRQDPENPSHAVEAKWSTIRGLRHSTGNPSSQQGQAAAAQVLLLQDTRMSRLLSSATRRSSLDSYTSTQPGRPSRYSLEEPPRPSASGAENMYAASPEIVSASSPENLVVQPPA